MKLQPPSAPMAPSDLPTPAPATLPPAPSPAEATPMESPNGSPFPGQSQLPRQRRQRWGTTAKILVALGAVVLIGGAAFGSYVWFGKSKGRIDLVLHKVQYERLELAITERGQLESGNNNDIVCKMKARAQGSNVASTIKWVIDDGSHVQKNHQPQSEIRGVLSWNPEEDRFVEETLNANGSVRVVKVEDKPGTRRFFYSDLLAELDDSGLQDTLKTQKITLDKAESDKVQAEEEYKITESQNKSDIEKAMTDLTIAELDLMKYTGWTRKE